jgi:hypothetical protein
VQRDFIYDPHSIVADPLFVDPNKVDFHLQPDSPCRDMGIDVGLMSDFEGNPIPQGLAADIGVYEDSHIRRVGSRTETSLSTSYIFRYGGRDGAANIPATVRLLAPRGKYVTCDYGD